MQNPNPNMVDHIIRPCLIVHYWLRKQNSLSVSFFRCVSLQSNRTNTNLISYNVCKFIYQVMLLHCELQS